MAEWLYALLTGDAGLADAMGVSPSDLPGRVWPDVAPQGTPSGWLVYTPSEALDRQALGPHARLSTIVPVNVRYVAQSEDPGVGSPVARRLYALLHGTHNTPVAEGGIILTARRTGVLNYAEDAGGIQYRHTGGLYDVEVN